MDGYNARPDATANPPAGSDLGPPGPSAVVREPLPAGPLDEKSLAVERADLAPVMAADGSGLPYELWQGLSLADIELQLAKVEIPPRSAALHGLWRRLITSDVSPPAGDPNGARFTAMRAEVLDRSGLVEAAAEVVGHAPTGVVDPVLAIVGARTAIGAGQRQRGCQNAKSLAASARDVPASLKAEAILIAGYCAAAAGDMSGAAINAALARELAEPGLAGPDILEAIASGTEPDLDTATRTTLLDYRIAELLPGTRQAGLPKGATPGLLAMLARDANAAPATRLLAAEAAASLNAISPDDLGQAYRQQSPGAASETAPDAASQRRAQLYRDAAGERTPLKKARLVRSFLDDCRRSGLYWPALVLMAREVATLQPVPEIGWFAETAIETELAVAAYDRARAWVSFADGLDQPGASPGFRHWLVLADMADPNLAGGRSNNLDSVEQLAERGRMDPMALHRLATVLEALEIQVPIPLWDKAGRTPQPAGGHLPETGVLTELQDAAKKKEFGHTVLLAMRALGPTGAEGANLLALGDSIRALRRAGLDGDARRLGIEAVFAGWPRGISN